MKEQILKWLEVIWMVGQVAICPPLLVRSLTKRLDSTYPPTEIKQYKWAFNRMEIYRCHYSYKLKRRMRWAIICSFPLWLWATTHFFAGSLIVSVISFLSLFSFSFEEWQMLGILLAAIYCINVIALLFDIVAYNIVKKANGIIKRNYIFESENDPYRPGGPAWETMGK